jgi:hypothetical protein
VLGRRTGPCAVAPLEQVNAVATHPPAAMRLVGMLQAGGRRQQQSAQSTGGRPDPGIPCPLKSGPHRALPGVIAVHGGACRHIESTSLRDYPHRLALPCPTSVGWSLNIAAGWRLYQNVQNLYRWGYHRNGCTCVNKQNSTFRQLYVLRSVISRFLSLTFGTTLRGDGFSCTILQEKSSSAMLQGRIVSLDAEVSGF